MAFDNTFTTPIPGSSLTHKLGDMPHEKPPKYVDPNEALEYFWKQFHRKDILKQLWYVLEQGATIWAIRRAILFKAAMEGIIQLNLAIVIGPTIDQMLLAIAKAKDIKGLKLNPDFRDKIADAMLDEKMNEIMGSPKGSPPLPSSALKMLAVPDPSHVTRVSEQNINSEPPPEAHAEQQPTPLKPEQEQGLLGPAAQLQQGA